MLLLIMLIEVTLSQMPRGKEGHRKEKTESCDMKKTQGEVGLWFTRDQITAKEEYKIRDDRASEFVQ